MKSLVYLQFIFVALVLYSSSYKSVKVNILKNSKIAIHGSSNVNKFICEYENVINLSNDIINYSLDDNQIKLKDTELLLNTKAFDCGNKGMNRDFKSLLNADKYENIKIQVLSIMPEKDCISITSNISISGHQKQYKFTVNASQNGSYKGSLDLNICDFDLKPPTKMLGLVKVDETITIEFDVYFEIEKI
ncbi:YceI family protein [Psychroflexus sp. MBR-150]|jgi:hypothetical protein